MEGRRDIKGEKEGVEQERRKERKKVLKERKIIKNNNKELLKKKNPKQKQKNQACWLQTGQASFAGLFGCSQLRGPSPALLCPSQPSGSLRPTQLLTGPWTHRFRHSPSWGPSLIRTLPGACGLTSLRIAHSPVGACGLRSVQGAHTPPGT